MTKQIQPLLKITIIGANTKLNSVFGRSTADNIFEVNYIPTQGVDISTKRMKVENKTIKLILVITAGEEFFGKLRQSYYRGSSACIILFEKKDRNSFKKVESFHETFTKMSRSVPIAIVGIKPDSREQRDLIEEKKVKEVTTEEGTQLATQLNCSYFETNLPNKNKIEEILYFVAKQTI
ncbi:MAG: hypothetical protein ACXACP_03270 [Candidatus Hodarchaeales archaeon]|jgi:GTPase SAR1 family protein